MPFVKGKSGNPKGRPVGARNRTELWQQIANEPMNYVPSEEEEKHKSIIRVIFKKALSGDMKAAELFIQRVEGNIATKVEVSPVLPVQPRLELLSDEQLNQFEDMSKIVNGTARDVEDEKSESSTP
jgi:hypothetical protein